MEIWGQNWYWLLRHLWLLSFIFWKMEKLHPFLHQFLLPNWQKKNNSFYSKKNTLKCNKNHNRQFFFRIRTFYFFFFKKNANMSSPPPPSTPQIGHQLKSLLFISSMIHIFISSMVHKSYIYFIYGTHQLSFISSMIHNYISYITDAQYRHGTSIRFYQKYRWRSNWFH